MLSGVSDAARDPAPSMADAVEFARMHSGIELIWAAPGSRSISIRPT
jgi:hypothetical protein